MTTGELIKKTRKLKKIPVETIASKLGVSKSTIYRYEDSSINKIPLDVFMQLCEILEVHPSELSGDGSNTDIDIFEYDFTPISFDDPLDATRFYLQLPSIKEFAEYDPSSIDDETLDEFANDLLMQLQLLKFKYFA